MKHNLYIFSFRSSREPSSESTFTRNLIPLVSSLFSQMYDIHITSEKKRLIYPKDKNVNYIHLNGEKEKFNSMFAKFHGFKNLNNFFRTTELQAGTLLFNHPAFLLACPRQVLQTHSVILVQNSPIDKYKKELRFMRKDLKLLVDKYVGFFITPSASLVPELKTFFNWKTNYVPISLPPADKNLAALPSKTFINKVVYIGAINKKDKNIHKLLQFFSKTKDIKFNIYGRFQNNGIESLVRRFENNHTNIQYCGITKKPSQVFMHHSALIVANPNELAGPVVGEGCKVGVPIINFANTSYAKKAVAYGCGINVDYNDQDKAIKKIASFVGSSDRLKAAQQKCKEFYDENLSTKKIVPRWKLVLSFGFSLRADN